MGENADNPLPGGVPAAAPGGAGADAVIFDGSVSMLIAFKTFVAVSLLELAAIALLVLGSLQKGSGTSMPLLVSGGALIMATNLMLVYTILSVRSQRYKITRKLIEREQGLIMRRVDALDLGRVKDIELSQSFIDRMVNIGTIEVYSSDKTDPEMLLEAIPNPRPVYEQLRDAVIEISQRRGIMPMN